MSHIDVGEKSITLNPEGYLVNFGDWDEKVAEALASTEDLALGHCHWEAIRYLREYYTEFEVNPSPRKLARTVGEKLTVGKCTTRTLDELFPLGGCRQACRLAGLPQFFRHAC